MLVLGHMNTHRLALGYPVLRAEPHQLLFLPGEDRLRHIYTIGRTGTGKSTFLHSSIMQDIHTGKGVCLIDPHGDLAESIVNSIPRSRVRECVYLNPQDVEYPLGFNPLFNIDVAQRSSTVNNIITTFKSMWGDSWGYQMEDILRHTLYALLEYPKDPGLTLLAIPRFLNDVTFRRRVLRHVKDPHISKYWRVDFNRLNQQQKDRSVGAILNKVGAYFASPVLRNIIGQVQTSFDIDMIMNNEGILIVNLSKGLLGEGDANLLGSLIVSSIQQAAMRRASIAPEERVPFYLYVDEFQNFTTDSFKSIVAEARKYALSLHVYHQYLEQIDDDILSAIMGNIGTLVAFNVGASDAERLSGEFLPFNASELMKNKRGRALVRMTKQGVVQTPIFFDAGLWKEERNSAKRVRNHTITHYSKPRKVVEEKINTWMGEGVRKLTPSKRRNFTRETYA